MNILQIYIIHKEYFILHKYIEWNILSRIDKPLTLT